MNNVIVGLIGIALFAFFFGNLYEEKKRDEERRAELEREFRELDVTLPPAPENPYQGTVSQSVEGTWQWSHTSYSNGSSLKPDVPVFTLSFSRDGRMTSTTDCNSLSGTYLIRGEALNFGPFATTKMYCEKSIESLYASDLARANSFYLDKNMLTIFLKDGYGVMYFLRSNNTPPPQVP